METGTQYGTRTNHDKGLRVNGVNGGFVKSEPSLDKGKVVDDKGKGGNSPRPDGGHNSSYPNNNKLHAMNAGYALQDGSTPTGAGANSMVESMRIEELPDEIQHITTEILPLGLLLSRLAQISHNHLGDLIDALAETPIPQHQPNGLPDFRNTVVEDNVPESLDKKKRILDFIQGLHTKWVKALVITEWSRKSDMVGKLIDIKGHLQQQLDLYPTLMWELAGVKRDLVYARLPQPDLKTALQVLSYGEVDWMPEFGYIEPPPLNAEEQLDWIENLNTLLEARLTLDEFDKIPHHFRNYTVDSGRVTFKVEGEYEVDLTIADEAFDKQFWFLDFRFAFTPAPEELTEATRNFLEIRVNDILATDGLAGCYTFLHEFTLTHKITEVVRQALELRRTRWIDSLRVERLHRSMSIQYWLARPQSAPQAGAQAGPPVNLKSWFLLGVHSDRKTEGSQHDPAATSRLYLRWFRDGKEVKDVDFPLDSSDIAAERILKMITGHHIEYILSSMYNKLASFPRYKNREAPLRLTISKTEPTQSQLVMQLSHEDDLVVRIDPITGSFALSPTTRTISMCERALNSNGKNPADEGHMLLERARWHYVMDELTRRGKSMGWVAHQPGLKHEELKPLLNTRDLHQTLWLRHLGWRPDWTVLVTMSSAGDRWWLVQL
jgi:mediator of RNA polymerase II transcription subunit 14